MSTEENEAVSRISSPSSGGQDFNPAVIDELAALDIRFEYSLHASCRGRH